MRPTFQKKIICVALFASAIAVEMLVPLAEARAQTGFVGKLLGNAECAIPKSVPLGPEVPVADKAVRAASKTICSNTSQLTFKEYVLDLLAYIVVSSILRAMTNQIIGWIQGTDADFIQNLQEEFIRTADAGAGGILNQLVGLNLCGNIGAFLKLTLGAPKTSFRQRMACTATQAVNNIEGFYRNFEQGGWNAFFKVTTEPQNNAYGAFMLTLGEQAQTVANRQLSLQQQLLHGLGFKGFEVPRDTNCQRISGGDAAELQEQLRVQQQVWGKENKPEQSVKTDNSDPENPTFQFCDVAYDVKTPGSLFSAALPEAVFSDKRRAEIADELDESVSAIVMALLQKVISASTGSGKGILGTREIAQMPLTTPSDYGFTPAYETSRADDALLRLGVAQKNLDTAIQDADRQVADIQKQIEAAQASCANAQAGSECDKKIADLQKQKSALEEKRNQAIDVLGGANQVIQTILDLRAQILATTDINQLTSLNTRLGNALADADAVFGQAGDPAPGLAGSDTNDNIARVAGAAQDHAASALAWLDGKIASETAAAKKGDLSASRAALAAASDEVGRARSAFLAAVSQQSGVAQAAKNLATAVNDLNARIKTSYEKFKAL